uniref:Uncharacterized protein n=1 Tax=Romanomermis culicivorax TaxID=13658 RepID=A0A915I3H8_ROMCU
MSRFLDKFRSNEMLCAGPAQSGSARQSPINTDWQNSPTIVKNWRVLLINKLDIFYVMLSESIYIRSIIYVS